MRIAEGEVIMKKRTTQQILTLLCLLVICIGVIGCKGTEAKGDFIGTKGSQFILKDEAFRFAGTNNYYLNYKDNEMIDDVIENAKDMNLKVIRCWAFLDGMGDSMKNNNAYMQTAPGIFDQIPEGARNGFEALDYALNKASEEGIYLVLVLSNNWNAFGGVDQYVEWSTTAESHDDFYTDAQCKEMYKNYVKYLLNRTNSINKLKYKDDPTIMSWELMNEARCESDPTGDSILNWADEMSTYIKTIDEKHLVAFGDEGFFKRLDAEPSQWAYNGFAGIDGDRILELENIGYGTFHLYPTHWGETFDYDAADSGSKWITKHVEAAQKVNKPTVLEEFGITKTGVENRDYVYEVWTNLAVSSGLNGTMFWILSGKDTGTSSDENGLYPDYDGFRVINNGDHTAQLLSNHGKEMAGEIIEKVPHIYFEAPFSGEKLTDNFAVKVKAVDYGKEMTDLKLTIDGIEGPFEVPASGALVFESSKYPLDGETIFNIEVTYSDGTICKNSVSAFVSNRATKLVPIKTFTFDNDLQGFEQDTTSQASFGPEGVSQSMELLDGSMKIDTIWPGKGDWEELRVVCKNLTDFSKYTKVSYDMYYRMDAVGEGVGVRPYAVANPGWVKLGLDLNNFPLGDLPQEEINGYNYAIQHLEIDIAGASSATELYIGIIGSKLPYQGPIYVDNIQLFEEVYID